MRDKLNEKGFIKGVIYLLIFSLLVFIGISFAMPYYRYYALKTQSEGYLKIERATPDMIKAKIMESAKELKVPVDENNLAITKYETGITLNASWSEEVDFFGYYHKKLFFALDIEN